MLSLLGSVLTTIAIVGIVGCIAMQGYFVWRANLAPETKADSQNKFMLGLAAFFGFFFIAIVGVILLQLSGAYGAAQ